MSQESTPPGANPKTKVPDSRQRLKFGRWLARAFLALWWTFIVTLAVGIAQYIGNHASPSIIPLVPSFISWVKELTPPSQVGLPILVVAFLALMVWLTFAAWKQRQWETEEGVEARVAVPVLDDSAHIVVSHDPMEYYDGTVVDDRTIVRGALDEVEIPTTRESLQSDTLATVDGLGSGESSSHQEESLPNQKTTNPVDAVTFTAYHPKELEQRQWQPMLFFLSLDTDAAHARVAAEAAERLASRLKTFRPAMSKDAVELARGMKLRLLPCVPGVRFNPAYMDVTWEQDVQRHEFQMRAETAIPRRAAEGAVHVYQGLVLRAEVPISVFVQPSIARLATPESYASAVARAYRKVFASYSHRDTPVVISCETSARSFGDTILRDALTLQTGQTWNDELIEMIKHADIFQLFWSRHAAISTFVTEEWRYALELLPNRERFIRPIYWTRTPYRIPPELSAIHFQQLDLSSMGWGRMRRLRYTVGRG